jgi:hypothetical protein
MKEDIEEPIKKSWKIFAALLFLLICLVGTAVLLLIWYLDDTQKTGLKINTLQAIMSGSVLLILIVVIAVILVNFYKPKKKKKRKPVFKTGAPVKKRNTSSKRKARKKY